MFIFMRIVLIFILCGKICSHNIGIKANAIKIERHTNDKLKYMDVLIHDLLNQHWEKEESICLKKFIDIMNNVKNSTLWAVWVWDSMQTPTGLLYGSQYNLGNFDQCLNTPWMETHPEFRTKYCLADIKLSETNPNNTIGDPYRSVEYHINSVTKHGLKFHKMTWGVCIPAECKTKSISKFVRSMFKYTHLRHEIYNVNVHHCQVAGRIVKCSWGMYSIIFLSVIMILVTVTCTIINNSKPTNNDTLGNKLIKAFCLATNSFYLNKFSKDDIKVLHGLRVLASFTVVSFHVIVMSHVVGFGNSLTLDKDLDRLYIKAALRADYAVDIFFLMSGLLRIKSFMAMGKINPFKAVLKRYLRYIILVGLFIVAIINIDIREGPLLYPKTDEASKACQKNWQITLLMLGNYIDVDNLCYPVLWTVACDFHFSVIATVLYWIFKNNQNKGFIAYVILIMAALIIPGVVNYHPNSPIVQAFDFRYIILVGLFIVVIINIDIREGPLLYPKTDEASKACQKNWHITLLMLGNYIDVDNLCYPVLWTVACDFHFSVIATVLYWIFKKNQNKGFIAYVILIMAALIIPGIVNYCPNLPIVQAFDFRLGEEYKKLFLNQSYTMTHVRGGPYAIGIALGYIMSTYKPERYRNAFSKLTSLIGMLLAATTAVAIIILGVSLQNKTDSDVLISFLYISLHRSIWALAIGSIIIVCEYGTVPLVRTVLTWSFFIPLSKISYCVYLVHVLVFGAIIGTTRSPLPYNALLLVLYSVAVMSISYIVSMLLYLFIEAPTNRIIDIMIDMKAESGQINDSTTRKELKTSKMHNNEAKKNI